MEKQEKHVITATIYLNVRVKNKDNTHPVKLRVSCNKKHKYYRLMNEKKKSYSFNIADFTEIFPDYKAGQKDLKDLGEKTLLKVSEIKELRRELTAIEKSANDILETIKGFTFKKFEKEFFTDRPDYDNNVIHDFTEYSKELEKNYKFETSSLFNASKNKIEKFKEHIKKKKLTWEDITEKFLKSFEEWLLKDNKSYNTISMYVRCINKLYNKAIKENRITKEFYPFGSDKYPIPKRSRNVKKALSVDEVKSIVNYEAKTKQELFAKDIWFFSFMCNGMNMADIAKLKYKNINKGKITFFRQKTINRNEYKTEISCIITPEVKQIIEKWGNPGTDKENYIFQIIDPEKSIKKQRAEVKQKTKEINKHLKIIASNCGITENLTTYFARHSFATIAKKMGYSYEFIQESLGHTDIKTTKTYLESFDDEVKQDFANNMMKLINI